MTENPYTSPRVPGELPVRKAGNLKRRVIEVLVVVAILGMIAFLILPNVRNAREPVRRMQCSNHLKQIALALQNYEEVYGALPPAYTVDAEGKRLHSWRTLILPFMEQQPLFEKIDLAKAWDDPANKEAFEASIPPYKCPSADYPARHTAYMAVVTSGGCFLPTEARKLADITDDYDLTLMVIEVDASQAVHWMSPTDVSEEWLLNLGTVSKLQHPNVAMAVCVNGRVLAVSKKTPAEALRALVSIAGNDDVVAGRGN